MNLTDEQREAFEAEIARQADTFGKAMRRTFRGLTTNADRTALVKSGLFRKDLPGA